MWVCAWIVWQRGTQPMGWVLTWTQQLWEKLHLFIILCSEGIKIQIHKFNNVSDWLSSQSLNINFCIQSFDPLPQLIWKGPLLCYWMIFWTVWWSWRTGWMLQWTRRCTALPTWRGRSCTEPLNRTNQAQTRTTIRSSHSHWCKLGARGLWVASLIVVALGLKDCVCV